MSKEGPKGETPNWVWYKIRADIIKLASIMLTDSLYSDLEALNILDKIPVRARSKILSLANAKDETARIRALQLKELYDKLRQIDHLPDAKKTIS